MIFQIHRLIMNKAGSLISRARRNAPKEMVLSKQMAL
jgi:hypothetical protein